MDRLIVLALLLPGFQPGREFTNTSRSGSGSQAAEIHPVRHKIIQDDTCDDTMQKTYCEVYSSRGGCDELYRNLRNWMRSNCQKSCGTCRDGGICEDSIQWSTCDWARRGKRCSELRLTGQCKRACELCQNSGPQTTVNLQDDYFTIGGLLNVTCSASTVGDIQWPGGRGQAMYKIILSRTLFGASVTEELAIYHALALIKRGHQQVKKDIPGARYHTSGGQDHHNIKNLLGNFFNMRLTFLLDRPKCTDTAWFECMFDYYDSQTDHRVTSVKAIQKFTGISPITDLRIEKVPLSITHDKRSKDTGTDDTGTKDERTDDENHVTYKCSFDGPLNITSQWSHKGCDRSQTTWLNVTDDVIEWDEPVNRSTNCTDSSYPYWSYSSSYTFNTSRLEICVLKCEVTSFNENKYVVARIFNKTEEERDPEDGWQSLWPWIVLFIVVIIVIILVILLVYCCLFRKKKGQNEANPDADDQDKSEGRRSLSDHHSSLFGGSNRSDRSIESQRTIDSQSTVDSYRSRDRNYNNRRRVSTVASDQLELRNTKFFINGSPFYTNPVVFRNNPTRCKAFDECHILPQYQCVPRPKRKRPGSSNRARDMGELPVYAQLDLPQSNVCSGTVWGGIKIHGVGIVGTTSNSV